MTKATIIAITSFVWTAGFAATGAFVYTVSSSLPKPPVIVASVPSAPPRMPHVEPERTIILPAVDIIGSMPHQAPVANIAPPPPRVHVIHCSEWRPLEQGSAAVQICD